MVVYSYAKLMDRLADRKNSDFNCQAIKRKVSDRFHTTMARHFNYATYPSAIHIMSEMANGHQRFLTSILHLDRIVPVIVGHRLNRYHSVVGFCVTIHINMYLESLDTCESN